MNSKNKNNNNNNNRNNNNSNNISSPPLPPSPSTPTFHIMTLNVQGLNSKKKQHQLSHMMDLHHISILGLSETKLSNSVAPYIFKKSSNYKLYSHNTDNNINSSGVSLLLSKEMDKYVHKHESYKGHIIYVDLFMKGHIKLRIIQIYLHATTTGNRPDIEDIYEHLFKFIEKALDNNFKIILMGDFNLKYDEFNKEYKRKGHAHWKFDIFRRLEQLNFTDLIPLYHSDVSAFDTFHSKNQNLSSSRIDAIWVSSNLLMDTLSADNFPIDLFNTDHDGVNVTLIRQGLFNQNSHAILKQHSIKKHVFFYGKMTSDKWDKFSSHFEPIAYSLSSSFNIHNCSTLNSAWTEIRKSIMESANRYIDNHFTSTEHKQEFHPKHISALSTHLKALNNILKIIAVDKVDNNYTFLIDNDNKNWIVIIKDNNNDLLITDPTRIKEIVNDHFQKCPGSKNVDKVIPSAWSSFYQPIETIDPNIYQNLMSPPSDNEWSLILSALPKDKASGPSGISNEMLIHLGPNMRSLIFDFISKCLDLADTPDKWRLAHVYPIPKPKMWECNLNNTRPITLLETLRKAVVCLLNNRLAKIFVDYNILKGTQFAGLP
ncbi:Endonuclease/exonuclease/phosphatase, partial [Glomus cerebriforme]